MADRGLDVELISATNLKKVNKSKMHAYVVAWIDPSVRVPGPVDKTNGSNPVWNYTITMALEARTLSQTMHLNLELLGQGFLSTKPIGSVVVPLAELLQRGASGCAAVAEFPEQPVILPSGEPQGTFSFVLRLKESPAMLAAAQSAQATAL
ncbi:protein SRC2 [Physcomitrium patens]|uniref:C2 domain-containing protein n=1 Tax=Physcomitrium patens TaxID=3218 RepID=A0A2K1L2T0_PHYPA|nr:uncharacterized protein LOC112278826 [Physcomitrium patens]PNR60332.1 hypothetical protein PHYPA_003125 [Physcomitrium patens]|eukprot:XP_024368415.1 uncharacterized protein LOC112278826 [Physcomitrella patens]